MSMRTVLIGLLLLVWLIGSWVIGERVAYDMEFRVNNFSIYPGTGSIQRNPSGNVYHVLPDNTARQVYPTLAPPTYFEQCPECRLMREGQLSGTNDFCATASRATLPQVSFEVPCGTGITLSDGPKVVTAVVYLLPIGLVLIVLGARRGIFKPRAVERNAGRSRYDR